MVIFFAGTDMFEYFPNLSWQSPIHYILIVIIVLGNMQEAKAAKNPMKTLRVLVVEDDNMIGMLLAEMLEGLGHDVCGIEVSEADAVTAAARCGPDMMIIDLHLGEGSGASAVEAILRHGPVPHVFVSGDLSLVSQLRPGAVFIRKPYREADLVLAMRRALGAQAA
jgi:CheY-like chemotaxis protein